MRITVRWKVPVHGDTRIVTKFVIFKQIGPEIRIFDLAKIRQRYEGHNYADDGWHDMEFVN